VTRFEPLHFRMKRRTNRAALLAKEPAPSGGRTSQYRLLLGDSWMFRRGIRFGIEHGAGDGTNSSARSVVFWYGIGAPLMHETDAIDVGSCDSEALHSYQSDGAAAWLTAFYEGDHDGNLSLPIDFPAGALPPLPGTDPMGESVTDDGRLHPVGSAIRFRIATDPRNAGVVLRRRLDQGVFGQSALVYVDGALAGSWLDPGMNGSKRWADSDFAIPGALSADKSALAIEIEVLPPVEPPLVSFSIPADPLEIAPPSLNLYLTSGWTDFRYDVFSVGESD